MFLISLLILKKLLKNVPFCRKLVEITPQKRPFFMKFWIFSLNVLMFLISLLIWKKLFKNVPFLQKIGQNNSQKRPFLLSFGYWASISNLKNQDRFEHEIVLKILSKSEPSCSYKIVLIKKKECTWSKKSPDTII